MATGEQFASHDSKIVSVFEIVGSYMVDTFFNHVYTSARSGLTSGSSLTDEYCRRLQAYVIGVKDDEQCYENVVRGIHQWFAAQTKFATINFASFVDRIVGVCIPPEYFAKFTTQDKDELLSSILCDLVSNLAAYASTPEMLRRIVDGHNETPAVTIRMLQDSAVQTLFSKRGALTNKFLRKMGQAREHVSVDILDNMKKALRKIVKEKTELKAKLEDADEAIAALKKGLNEAKTREAKALKLVSLLRAGRDQGPAAAGAALQVPARDTIGEDPLDLQQDARRIPRRDRIAEIPDGDSASEEGSSSSVTSGSGGSNAESSESDEEPPERQQKSRSSAGKSRGGTEKSRGGTEKSRAPARVPASAPAKVPAPARAPAPAPHGKHSHSGSHTAPRAAAQSALPGNFFKTVGAARPTPTTARPAPATAPPARAAPVVTPPRQPAMLSNLLDDVVDTEDDFLAGILGEDD